mmetsp:Transcript_25722/g.58530  ORF Transcript_25722/g.58530 Transcript_25722/m.58530 type:complete len:256 (-) Transcript_25722:52-819(-)
MTWTALLRPPAAHGPALAAHDQAHAPPPLAPAQGTPGAAHHGLLRALTTVMLAPCCATSASDQTRRRGGTTSTTSGGLTRTKCSVGKHRQKCTRVCMVRPNSARCQARRLFRKDQARAWRTSTPRDTAWARCTARQALCHGRTWGSCTVRPPFSRGRTWARCTARPSPCPDRGWARCRARLRTRRDRTRARCTPSPPPGRSLAWCAGHARRRPGRSWARPCSNISAAVARRRWADGGGLIRLPSCPVRIRGPEDL